MTAEHSADVPEYLADVQLAGEDGNGFAIVARVRVGLRRAGAPDSYVDAFTKDATSGDYDHLLQTAMRYCRNGGM